MTEIDGEYDYDLAVTNGITDTSSILFGEPGGVPGDSSTAVALVSPTAGLGGTVQVPWAPELNPDIPWSVETWVQPASLGVNGNDYRVVLSSEYNEYPFPYNGWYMYQQPNGTFAFVPQPANGFITAGSITPGNWYHLVVTDDGTNFNFYINGVLAVAPAPVTDFIPNGDGINPDGTPGLGGDDGANFVMGQRTDGAFNTYQGAMEDTAIYNYALTPKQIMTHYLNQINLTISKSGGSAIVNWPAGTGTLEESAHVNGPYTTLTGVAPPYTNSMSGTMFYRLLRQ
ncbi:MAG TPA: LamG domain-containing protein [Alphaproteobacteria bacterium]|nr:LamG domain-containing protein [Alphaproteobacteria bacterium]